MWATHELTEELEIVHIYPLFGKEHILDGLMCWCNPEMDEECPGLILHNVIQ